MRRLLDIVKAASRPFGSWKEFFEYLIFLGVCAAGVANLSWLWIAIGGMLLLLTTWPRYRDIYAKAARIDEEWRELGSLERRFKVGSGWRLYARARVLPMVVLMKLGHDSAFIAGAFFFGQAERWFWFG